MKIFKKITKYLFIAAVILVLGGIGSFLIDTTVLPRLAVTEPFSRYEFIKKANENVTIINKTETIEVKEEKSVTEIANQAVNSVVGIISGGADSQPQTVRELAIGTGTILTGDGVIATFRSAINEQAKSFTVFWQGKEYPAQMLGIDEYSDLAFLKISAENLPIISIANSDEAKLGQRLVLLAINPRLNSPIYNAGNLSSIDKTFNISGRSISYSEKMDGVFRSSLEDSLNIAGAPVINFSGEMIGLGGKVRIDNEDIFFQIPSNQVRNSLKKVVDKNNLKQARLGVYYLPITGELAKINSLPAAEGALIYSPTMQQGLAVIANLPAFRAGIKVGDIIIQVNGEKVTLDNSLSKLIDTRLAGEEITLKLLRAGKEMEVKVDM